MAFVTPTRSHLVLPCRSLPLKARKCKTTSGNAKRHQNPVFPDCGRKKFSGSGRNFSRTALKPSPHGLLWIVLQLKVAYVHWSAPTMALIQKREKKYCRGHLLAAQVLFPEPNPGHFYYSNFQYIFTPPRIGPKPGPRHAVHETCTMYSIWRSNISIKSLLQ